jgi:hypothetical protein
MPLADLKLHHAIIDARIAFPLVKGLNKKLKKGNKIREVSEDRVLETFFTEEAVPSGRRRWICSTGWRFEVLSDRLGCGDRRFFGPYPSSREDDGFAR